MSLKEKIYKSFNNHDNPLKETDSKILKDPLSPHLNEIKKTISVTEGSNERI